MDINYELYKVFYHVASTLSFSEASKQLFHLPVGGQPVDQGTGEETEPDSFHPQHKKSTAYPGRRDPTQARRTGDEPDPSGRKPAARL